MTRERDQRQGGVGAMQDAKEVIGSPTSSFWLYSDEEGFDLTHPASPSSPPVQPRLPIKTTTLDNITIDPAKSALVIIDMQNFFLSPALGKAEGSKGMKAANSLLEEAIPACRKAGVRIVWLNWGLTDREIEEMPPAVLKAFGSGSRSKDKESKNGEKSDAGSRGFYTGLGSDMGTVTLPDGSKVEAGRLLMRDQWNSALYPSLERERQKSLDDGPAGSKGGLKDEWIHKNRMSGFWGTETLATRYLDEQGIKTLIFAGVNTDQCVGGSLQDAYTRGYDCILLTDGCATSTPEAEGGQSCVEWNAGRVWGFGISCADLVEGVDNMSTGT